MISICQTNVPAFNFECSFVEVHLVLFQICFLLLGIISPRHANINHLFKMITLIGSSLVGTSAIFLIIPN
jgi:hypothetical protein